MKTMKIIRKFIAFTAIFVGMTCWAGDSASFLLDTTDQLVATGGEVSFSYNSSWIGGDSSAEVVITVDGVEIKRTTGEGGFAWVPTTPGKHTLTYMTYIDGVAQEEVYTATVFKDWKYTVEDGKATIIGTTQTSGDVVIPSEIDGCPVVGIGSDVFVNADIESVTIPSGLLMVGKPGFIEAEFKSMTSFDDAISIIDNSRGVVLSADRLTADTITDHTMYGYAAKMFFEGGVEYGFLAYYDDKSSVKIDGVNVISASSVECRSQTCTVKYEESGWHDIELRGWNNGGEGAAYGSCEGIMWKKGSGSWQKFADPGDGSLFRVGATYSIKEMFPGCFGKIKRIELTGEVTEIPDGFFADCAALASFTIPNGVTTIGANAFENCSSLSEVTIPDSVTTIGSNAFDGCSSLAEIVIPDSVYSIGTNVFAKCTGLKKVSMPFPLRTQVEAGNVFAGCSEDLEIVYREAEIKNVVAKQRYPWNGKVDISFEIEGNVFAGFSPNALPVLRVTAEDRKTGAKYIASETYLSGDTNLLSGAHKIVWDLRADGYEFRSDEVMFSVACAPMLPSTYCVIDLSAGKSASSYPVTYLSDVPAGGWTDEYKTTKLVLRRIEPGSFKMNGSYDVTLIKPYYCGVFEVTQKQYELVTGNRPSNFMGDKLPVESVSWDMIRGNSDTYNWPSVKTVDSNSFVGRLQARTGLNIDLPTEAQWEYACRAGTTTVYNYGDSANSDYMWYYKSGTREVGLQPPNVWGLYDMHGNVYEWALDWYGSLASGSEPEGSFSGAYRVVRGGGWGFGAKYCASSYRSGNSPHEYYYDGGFRLVVKVDELNVDALMDEFVYSGLSEPVKIDSRIELVRESVEIAYNSSWVGGKSDATVVVRDNGTEIMRTSGEGDFIWSPTAIGKHTLTYTTYINGVAQDEVYTATVFKDWKYTVQYGVAKILETIHTSGIVTIPSEIDGYQVASIGYDCFSDCANITSVMMPGRVLEKMSNIFPDCYDKLTSVTLTGDFMRIPANAFEGCSSLVSVVIPNGVKEISPTAFSGCISLASIDLPDTLTNYNFDCIKGTGLEKYDANGLCIVDGWLLACNNKDISSLVVPNGVVGIGRYALAEMYNLKTVTLPQSLKYISEGAFKGDSYLDNLAIPSNVQTIGANAFEDCSYLQTLTVGGVKSVGDRAFAGCTQLSSAIFKNGLVEIGDCAFSNCWRMQSVSLPHSVTNVESTAFTGCWSLTGVTVPSGVDPLSDWFAPIYSQIRDVTIPVGEKNICEKMFEGCSSLVNIEISEGITNISASAFRNCRSVETLFVPDSVLSIGDDAFRGCSRLKTFIMPEIMRSIGASAFRDCYNLEDISLSRNLTELPDYVFYGTSLDSVTVPATVTYLGSYIVSSATTDIYYMGNAPDYAEDVYDGASNSLTTWVTKDTLGWDGRPNSRDLPSQWLGRDIKFWTVNQFDVTFDANGGIFAPVSSDKYACEQTTYTWYALPPFEPTRLGYKFDGYWTEPEGGTRIYSTMNVKLTKAHTLYAHWDRGPVVKVRFNANGGTITPNEIEFTAGGTFGTLPVPTREHYVFEGWYTEASGGERMYPSSEVPSANRELFAHWSPCSYTIRFHANNGTDAIMEQSFTYGDTVTLRYNTFSFRGCEFAGWALAPGGKAVYADGKKLTDVSAVRDGIIHLYATWVGNIYSVRFDSHGGVGRMDNQTFAIGVAQSLMPCTYTRSGYRFVGWALSTTAGVSYRDREMVKNLSTTRNAIVTLYAVWEAVVTPNPGPTPTPNPIPTPEPVPELGEGDYEVGGEMSDASIPVNAASVYDGYVYSDNMVVGTIQAKVAKPKNDIAKVTATIQITGEKKVSVKGELDVASGKLEAYARDGRELYLEFGSYGVKGSFGSYEIDGARNFFDSKDKGEKSAAEEILKPYLGAYSMICDGGILSVNIAKKGKVTVKGTIDGNKVSAKAQVLIGEDVLCIPVIYSKKSVNLAFTIWLPIDGGNAEVIGLGDNAIIGKAGTLKNGAKFIIDGDIGASIETEDERTLELLPNGEIVTVSGSKWLVADGIKQAKVAYKKGEFTITEGRKGAGIANPSGLNLTYKSKDGSFKGSFTAYGIVKGKLKKHKASVEGVLVNGVGYGTITIKRIGTWAVTIK